MTRYAFLPGLVAALAVVGCNEVPVGNLTSSYIVQVEELREHATPAKLDILWVVDDSPSMCQEQQSLASSFHKFLGVFQQFAGIDMRLAVTTTNVCDKDKAGAIRGRFVYQPATEFPPSCLQKRVFPCQTDLDCANNPALTDAANWACEDEPAQFMYTCDKSPAIYGPDPDKYPGDILHTINSVCRYKCDKETAPAACAQVFGKPEGCTATCGASCSIPSCQSASSLSVPDSCGLLCAVGAECDSKCNEVIKDTAKCQEICSLEPQACFTRCAEISKEPSCTNVCASDWDCMKKCETYLYDGFKCENMCASGSRCLETCAFGITEDNIKKPCVTLDDCPSGEGYVACRITSPTGTDGHCAKCQGPGDCPPNMGYNTCSNGFCQVTPEFPKDDFLCSLACDGTYDCNDKCTAEFGDSSYRCLYPGGSTGKEDAGCLLPPATKYCPSNGPTMLDHVVAERYFDDWKSLKWPGNPDWQGLDDDTVKELIFEQLFICMASVGAAQNTCGSQEQGLLAAWMALDRNGENAAQANTFLRDDAFLLIIIVSDEDDCSSIEKVPTIESRWCACKADTHGCTPDGRCESAPGPLYPVSTFVNKLKSIKSDPAQVVMATIVGDVIPGSSSSPGEDTGQIRDRFYECKCDQKGPSFNGKVYAVQTYACLSAQGKADIGSRYMQATAGFGTRYGQTSNICDDQGLDGSLTEIANLVIPLLTAICLPRPIDEGEFLQVTVVNEFDDPFPQEEITPTNPDGDFELIKNFPACPKFSAMDGNSTFNAIRFAQPLEYLDRVQMTYRATPFYVEQ